MNYSVYNIRLDLHKSASQASLITPKYDTKRKIVITLTENNKPYAIAEGCYAVFTAKKADGKVIYNDCVIEDNRVVYAFTEQTAASEGVMNCQIELYGTDSELISSPSFVLTVFPKVYDGEEEVESTNEFTALQKLITEVNDMLNDGALRGDDGVSVTNAAVNESGELVMTLSDGNEINAGFVKGEKGDTGDPGPQGLKGDKGDKGETGPEGPQGIQGIQGIQGEVGPKGDTGPQGERGLRGEQGIQGIQGVPGETGPKGDTGPQGEQGVQGIQGEVGPKGASGVVISSEEPTDPEVNVWINPEADPDVEYGDIDPDAIKNAVNDYLQKNPIEESDPTISDWAKQPEKPKYTADEVGAISTDKLGEAVNEALATAKASGEFDGKDGQDGYTPQKGVDYFDGEGGKDGTSVTVTKVTESEVDGGENIVEFSDGKTLTVKNGRAGSNGNNGNDGTTPHIGGNGNWFIGETDTGVKAQGKDGQNGVTPNIQIGAVETLEAGADATATITGTLENPLLNLGIPRGADGSGGGSGGGEWELLHETTTTEVVSSIEAVLDGAYREFIVMIITAYDENVSKYLAVYVNGKRITEEQTNRNKARQSTTHIMVLPSAGAVYNITAYNQEPSAYIGSVTKGGFQNGVPFADNITISTNVYGNEGSNGRIFAVGSIFKIWGRK